MGYGLKSPELTITFSDYPTSIKNSIDKETILVFLLGIKKPNQNGSTYMVEMSGLWSTRPHLIALLVTHLMVLYIPSLSLRWRSQTTFARLHGVL